MQVLPERPLSQPRVFVSHRMADVPYAERIAWLASRKAGLEYSLDVHDPVLRLASAALPPGHPVYAITVASAKRLHGWNGSAGSGRLTCGFFRSCRERHDRIGRVSSIADTIGSRSIRQLTSWQQPPV